MQRRSCFDSSFSLLNACVFKWLCTGGCRLYILPDSTDIAGQTVAGEPLGRSWRLGVSCVRGSGLEQLGHPALPVPASLRCAIPQVSRHSNLSHRTCSAEGPAGLVRDGLLAVGSSTAPLHMTRRLAICAMDSEWAAGTYSTFARRVVAGQTDHLECSKKTLVVVEEACFTRAAAKLHVAQPGVSAQIRRLERELGQELLDRSGRAVRPTEVGAAVLPYARAALSAVAGARLAVDELIGLVRGYVAVGTVTSHNVDLSALLAAFHEDHPAVEITLAEDNSDQLIDALRGARLDAAIIAMGATPPPDLEIHIVADESIVAAVSQRDDLAKRSTIPLGSAGLPTAHVLSTENRHLYTAC